MDFWNYIDVFSIFLCLLYFVQLRVLKKHRSKADRYFSAFILSLGFILLYAFFVSKAYRDFFIIFIPIFIGGILFLGPFIWMNFTSYIDPKRNLNLKTHLLTPLLFTVFAIVLVILFFTLKSSQSNLLKLFLITLYTSTSLFVIQNIYYISACIRQLRKHKKNIQKYFVNKETIALNWLYFYLSGYILFFVVITITNIFQSEMGDHVHTLFVFLFVNFIGLNTLKQEEVYKEDELIDEGIENNKTIEFLEPLNVKFIKLMVDDKIYLQSDLTLFSLAKQLETNTNYLSQLINSKYQMSFGNLVNSYRIEFAKNALLDVKNANLTIESIGHLSGFNSKSAFNAAFKKYTNETPSSYMKMIKGGKY